MVVINTKISLDELSNSLQDTNNILVKNIEQLQQDKYNKEDVIKTFKDVSDKIKKNESNILNNKQNEISILPFKIPILSKKLISIIVIFVLFFSFQKKININFTDKRFKNLQYILIILTFVYFIQWLSQYYIIHKDSIQNNKSILDNLGTSIKSELNDLNTGYIKSISDEIKHLYEKPEPKPTYEINSDLKEELISNNVLGIIKTNDNIYYSIKQDSKKRYYLESKIDRNIMNSRKISVDKQNKEYISIKDSISEWFDFTDKNLYEILE